jgi:hypothetical protein
VAFPDLTPFDWADAPSTSTPITAANLEDMQTHVYNALRDDIATQIHESAPTIEFWGASTTGTAAANTTAINTALAASDKVVVPAGKEYAFSSTLTIPTKTTLVLDGALRATGTWAGGSVAVRMGDGTFQGDRGGISGIGTIWCDRKPTTFLEVNCWRRGTFRDFAFADPITNGIVVKNTSTTADCDSHIFDNITMRTSGAFSAIEKPARMFLFDGTGTKIVSDSTVSNCTAIGGLLPSNIVSGTDNLSGAWVVEMVNCQRFAFENNRFYGHNERDVGGSNVGYSGGYLIRATGTQTCSAWTIHNPYIEATVDGPVHSAWVFHVIRCLASDSADINYATVSGLQQSVNAASSNAKRLRLFNSGTGSVQWNKYLMPRNNLGATTQIVLGDNCDNNYIEVLGGPEPAYVNNTDGGTGNTIHTLSPWGNP